MADSPVAMDENAPTNAQTTSSKTASNLQEKLIQSRKSVNNDDLEALHDRISRPALADLVNRDFYKKENWFDEMCETLFKIKTRNTTIKAEVYYGLIHFISCLYCLAVIPQQLKAAGYDSRSTVVSVAACSGVGSIFTGLFANLPFVLAPPTVVSIFLSVYLQQHSAGPAEGNVATIISGFVLIFFGWKPLFQFVAQLIPVPIQVGTAVGIGLMTALAGSTEINLVVKGEYTILDIGAITVEIVIAMLGVLLVCVAMVYHVKGSFCLAVVVCSLLWWGYDNDWPSSVFAAPHSDLATWGSAGNQHIPLLTVDLVFLYVLYLNGLVTSLSNLAVLTREDGSAPRGRWIFIMSGLFTIVGGLLSAPPILISPESSASIKAGAKTGLSTVVCGVLFCLSLFLSPIFENVPAAGTSPVLIMIGVVLFQNVGRVDWHNISEAAPAFVVLFYIPFTYSVIQGVLLGYIVYLFITLNSGELRDNAYLLLLRYFPDQGPLLGRLRDRLTWATAEERDSHNQQQQREQLQKDSESSAHRRQSNASFDCSDGHRRKSLERALRGGGESPGMNLTMSMSSSSSGVLSSAGNPLMQNHADFSTGFHTRKLPVPDQRDTELGRDSDKPDRRSSQS